MATLPTGGGKTVLASHAIKVTTRAYLEQDYPIVLWLVPTNTIQQQTLEALKQPGHPYRAELDRAFNQRVRIFDADEVTQIRPHDIGTQTIVVVSTLANLRVSDTSSRKIYAYHEDFEPHFVSVNPNDERLEHVTQADLKENGLGPSQLGKIKYSFANLLALKRPLIIMDEAHNARTPLTFETLQRVHPTCIIEFTATPDQNDTSASNVLYHVSASELKAEEMIKLPIMFTEHNDWQAAVRDASLTRNKLATEAQKDDGYIRPIVLLQADKKNGEVPWQRLKTHLNRRAAYCGGEDCGGHRQPARAGRHLITKTVAHLLGNKGYSLTALVRSKFLLEKAVRQRLKLLQSRAAEKGFQMTIFEEAIPLEASFDYSYEFKPGLYTARVPFYSGRYKFKKHYYPVIEDLKVDGEEFRCAQTIDTKSKVKHWVRNLVDRQQASFRLPLGTNWFYPDFVAELEDGRLFVIEYKGEIYKTTDDSRIKNAVGQRWARESGGRCLFLMAVETDNEGRNVDQQIDAAIG